MNAPLLEELIEGKGVGAIEFFKSNAAKNDG
jgi:hypothetical protein